MKRLYLIYRKDIMEYPYICLVGTRNREHIWKTELLVRMHFQIL